ncbi:MAG: hypothetical protein CL463_01400 [Acidimicrobiaceae bacterium]|nr:hypothetical protein [Acidimicrobiaceae bacterium]|tara:strand:+ start:234 stop:716 length:483 start_codon:yes stop_codon:yes gene_type:complete
MEDFATADLLDQFPESEVLSPGLSPFGGKPSFYGQVETVTAPEDNSFVRKSLEKPGGNKVLVVDGGGSSLCALLGDQLAQLAVDNGWAAVIVHGYIRDSQVIAGIPIGVRALGTTPRRSIKEDKGCIGEPVRFLGVTINPGYWIYADSDGVVVSKSNLLL